MLWWEKGLSYIIEGMWGGENLSDVTFMPLCEPHADSGSLAGTDKTYISSPSAASGTGQRDVPDTGLMDYRARMYSPWLGRFIQPDTIVPGAGNSQAWNRYSYGLNNPVKYIDPDGHKPCEETREGCGESLEDWGDNYKLARLFTQSEKILKRLGGKNDVEALAQIVDTSASLYYHKDKPESQKKFVQAVSHVILGTGAYGPLALISTLGVDGCFGVGRDWNDCSSNSIYFSDVGFHPDFQDNYNQPYHVWGYIAQTAGGSPGYGIANIGNYFHEIIQSDLRIPQNGMGTSWQDFTLSIAGMRIGQLVSNGDISPYQMGDILRVDLGVNGPGSNGWTDRLIDNYGKLTGMP